MRTWRIFQKPMYTLLVLLVGRKSYPFTIAVIHQSFHQALLHQRRYLTNHLFCDGSEMGS